jgi:hypothetical protein
MDFSNVYNTDNQTNYLNGKNVLTALSARIISAELRTFKDGSSKVVLSVNTASFGPSEFVLNKTNFGKMVECFGPDSDGWIKRAIILTPTNIIFNGKQVISIVLTPHPKEELVTTFAPLPPDEDPFVQNW